MSMPGSAPELGNGWSRSPRYSGSCEQRPIGQPTSPPSSWCTGQRSCYPLNCSMPPTVRAYQPGAVKEARKDTIDLLEESRDITVMRSAGYQQALRQYHVCRVYPRAFQVGDLVLRQVQTKNGKHKLSPPWEGPYLVAEVLRPGAY
jgi:hypothetical protein